MSRIEIGNFKFIQKIKFRAKPFRESFPGEIKDDESIGNSNPVRTRLRDGFGGPDFRSGRFRMIRFLKVRR